MRLQSQEVSLVRNKWDLREILQKNAVTVMFVLLCLIGLVCSGQTVSYVMYELFGRLSRNSFIVLALIIPIIAGMGINFAITIGAMAAQIAALWVIAQKYDNQKQLPPPRGCFWFIKSHFAVKLKRFIKMNTTFLLYSTRKTVAIRARLQSCTQNPKND